VWCWGALTNFPCEVRLKNFFTAMGGADAPTAPLATPMRIITDQRCQQDCTAVKVTVDDADDDAGEVIMLRCLQC